MNQQFYDAMEESPVIAAVKDFEGLEKCCRIEEIRVVFILFGDVCNIDEIVRKVREKGKIAMVHIDLISGLGSKEIAVDFIKRAGSFWFLPRLFLPGCSIIFTARAICCPRILFRYALYFGEYVTITISFMSPFTTGTSL